VSLDLDPGVLFSISAAYEVGKMAAGEQLDPENVGDRFGALLRHVGRPLVDSAIEQLQAMDPDTRVAVFKEWAMATTEALP
jgi:molybdopterin/thiamine biosynthesis adenylyltransferase